MPWGTVTPGTEITSALLRPYFRAREERYCAAYDTATPDVVVDPAPGDTFAVLSGGAGDATITRAQSSTGYANWVATHKWNGAGYDALTNYDGEPAIRSWGSVDNADEANIFAAVLGHAGGFQRGAIREILDLTDADYIDPTAGPIANGHKARFCGAGDLAGRVVERVAGEWVDAGDDARPDLVTVYGDPQEGDVLGSWLFNETRSILQSLKWRAAVSAHGWNAYSGDSYHLGFGSGATWAEAKANAEADWDSRSDEVANNPPEAWSTGTFNGVDWYEATLARWREKIKLALQVQFPKDAVEFYIGPGTAPNGDTFAANGDTVSESTVKLFESQASVAAATAEVTSGWFGTLATKPAWCVDPTSDPDNATAKGYVGGGGSGIEKLSGFTDT